MTITEFKKAIEEIEQTPEIYSIINLQNTKETLEDRIKFVKEKINELEVSRDNILQFIETDGNVDTSKVIEVQENIKKKYLELSITNNIAKVSYDDKIPESNCIRVSIQQLLPRTYFVEEKSVAKFLNEPSRSDNADQEEKEVFNFIISKIQSTVDNGVDYLKQIQEQVKKLKDKGFNPNVIFMPLSVKFKLQRDNWGLFKNNVLEINDSKLLIIRSWKKFNFKNMVIFDSNGLGITYKAPDKENRIVVDYSGTESGTRYVVYTSKNSFILEILNSEAFVNIENNEIKLLDN